MMGRRMITAIGLLPALLGTAVAPAHAVEERLLVPVTRDCIDNAARRFGHPPLALRLILEKERGRVGACSAPNRNGTVDCGPAQINEVEIRDVAKVLRRPEEQVFRLVRDNGCFNVMIGAYVLAKKKRDAKGDLWDAMGRYNSATPGIKEQYQQGLIKEYQRLSKGQ